MRKLNLSDAPTVTVIGKAFFDMGHALKGHFNRRKYMPGHAAWEIHSVMKIEALWWKSARLKNGVALPQDAN